MPSFPLRSLGLASAACALAIAGAADPAWAQQPEPWQVDMQNAATPVMESMRAFHTFVLVIITLIVLLVTVLLGWCMVRFSASRNPTPDKTTHNTLVEVVWTVLPVLILVAIAIPSFRLLYDQQVIPVSDMTVKATGHQWYWSYEYPDNGELTFDSYPIEDKDIDPAKGHVRNLSVDNEVVVPVGKIIRVISTSDDVLHSWAMPAFGMKVDAVPGRLNSGWFKAERTGVFRGQCSELCGRSHYFMPIVVRVVTEPEFQAWVGERRAAAARAAPQRLAAR